MRKLALAARLAGHRMSAKKPTYAGVQIDDRAAEVEMPRELSVAVSA